MEMALTFNDFTFSPVSYQNKIWIRATELARVLGYSRDNLVTRLYHSNEDEFTPEMTQVIEISDSTDSVSSENLVNKVRIFSLRGCHLLAMFARTPVAKAFRKWVLDVLDRIAREESEKDIKKETGESAIITHDQQRTLQNIVDAKVRKASGANNPVRRELYAQIWNRFKNHFLLARYQQLPQTKLAEAVAYLVQLDILPKKQKAIHEEPKAICSGSLNTDKYEDYIMEVEAFRADTAARIEDLLHKGLSLVDARILGTGGIIACTPILLDWLQRIAGQTSPMLRKNEPMSRAIDYSPLYLLRHLEKAYPTQ